MTGPQLRSMLPRGARARLMAGLLLIAPALLLGAGDDAAPVASVPALSARTPVEVSADVARDRQRLDALFADHYDIPLPLAERIHSMAREEQVDPVVAFGLVSTESSFRRGAVSFRGAVGYTQLLPSTARWLEPGLTRRDLFTTDVNLRLGFRYLHYLLDKYDGDVRMALTAYNRGPGTVDKLVSRGHDPENGYADRVLGTRRDRARRS